jgi:hypothetical protein
MASTAGRRAGRGFLLDRPQESQRRVGTSGYDAAEIRPRLGSIRQGARLTAGTPPGRRGAEARDILLRVQ